MDEQEYIAYKGLMLKKTGHSKHNGPMLFHKRGYIYMSSGTTDKMNRYKA